MTTDPRTVAERIASRLDSATYEIGKERETRVEILEAEIAAIFRMAEAAQDWMPCDERMPDVGLDVLLTNGSDYVTGQVAAIGKPDHLRLDQGDRFVLLSTKGYRHWQPLPKPPEVSK